MGKRKKSKHWKKILVWFIVILLLLAGGLFAIGYFYYGSLIRTYLKETVYTQSKGIYRAEIGEIYLDVLNGNLHVQGRCSTASVWPLTVRCKSAPVQCIHLWNNAEGQ